MTIPPEASGNKGQIGTYEQPVRRDFLFVIARRVSLLSRKVPSLRVKYSQISKYQGAPVTAAKKDILQGWKDIAVYVSRDVRTVKRWEKQRGLPVRRMPGEGRANVYALIPELDSWLSSDTMDIDPDAKASSSAITDDPRSAEDTASALHIDAVNINPISAQPQPDSEVFRTRRSWSFAAAGLIFLSTIAAFAFGMRAHHRNQALFDNPAPGSAEIVHAIRYSSKQPGVDALYLRGIYFYEQRTPEMLNKALSCFQEAIAKDPSYAPAYSGLAQTYNLLREHSMMPEADAYAKAKAAAQHAIALDPDLPDAHAALAFVEFFWDWDPVTAEHEFKTSIALDPNSALVHHWYGSMLTHEGRFDESLEQLNLAQQLQPTSPSIVSDHAFALGLSGHRDEAVDALEAIINDDSHSPEPHFVLAVLSLIEPRDMARYLDEMRRYAALRQDSSRIRILDTIEPVFRKSGGPALWRAWLAEQQARHPGPNDRTMEMADAEAVLGLDDACLHDLSQLAQRHDPSTIGIVIDPSFARLHHDPRFTSVVAAVGVPLPR